MDDHSGKSASKDMENWTNMPAIIGGDVILVRAALLEYLRAGHPVGMTIEEIQSLRWYGASP